MIAQVTIRTDEGQLVEAVTLVENQKFMRPYMLPIQDKNKLVSMIELEFKIHKIKKNFKVKIK